ncbi:MAG TPA: SelB C-terminal domain-containing protein, partial [Capsulimonadaceae bacterium]|nr:SelB C-terminal domain-containing protein [Capsulimonadaceae bacterium]
GAIQLGGGLVAEAGFSPEAALSPMEREIANRMEQKFAKAGLAPPDPTLVIGKDRRAKNLYNYLLDSGTLVATTDRVSGRFVTFHRSALLRAEEILKERLSPAQGYTVSELNTLLGITRKYGIPLLEHLDSLGVTRRVGDLRFLAAPPAQK